jgi:hypothetical protein
MKALAPCAAFLLLGAIGMGLLLGLWGLVAGYSLNDTERFFAPASPASSSSSA